MKELTVPDILPPMEGPHSTYADLDPTIERWVAQNGLLLCREWQGEARFWYTSRAAECFQVAVAPPVHGSVKVSVWSVETDDDADLLGEWEVSVKDIEKGLAAATAQIEQWSLRRKAVR